MKLKIGILTSFDNTYKKYIGACRDLNVDYEVVDILAPDWAQNVKKSDCRGFLARPPSDFQERKAFFDERLYCINKVLNYPIYPSWEELYIYENKRMVAHWLEIHGFPHPKTHIFVRKQDALKHLKQCAYPVVFKASTGSAAKLVNIVKNYTQARKIIGKIFGLFHPVTASGYNGYSFRGIPIPLPGANQRHYAIVQEFHKIKWEWRVIKIGDSFFGRKKLLRGDFASGSHRVGWERPPDEVLFLANEICEKGNFLSMGVDVFETHDARFLVNELQSITGIRSGVKMLAADKPGRLRLIDDKFVFEEGEFNQHDGYLARARHFLDILGSSCADLDNPLDGAQEK
jgi:glutathione synthase/RimK-type ligase-like ATP-grasp enzyme